MVSASQEWSLSSRLMGMSGVYCKQMSIRCHYSQLKLGQCAELQRRCLYQDTCLTSVEMCLGVNTLENKVFSSITFADALT